LEASLIAVEEGQRTVCACQGFKSDREPVVFGDLVIFLFEGVGLGVHFVLEEAGFDTAVTCETPVGSGELMNQIGFRFVLGEEMVEVSAEVGLVLVFGFIVEDDGAGGEAVLDGVLGGGAGGFGGGWIDGAVSLD